MTSSVLAKKRVKAEVQRTRLEYIEKQTQLMKHKAKLSEDETQAKAASDRKKAEVDADLVLLKQQTETAVAEAEVKALRMLKVISSLYRRLNR